MQSTVANDTFQQIAEKFNLPAVTAKILYQRGFDTEDRLHAFLYPQLSMLPPPASMKGMAAATDLLIRAWQAKKTIFIHGDYDVDGVTATALLVAFFQEIGAQTAWYIPHRIQEKYGLSESSIDNLLDGHCLTGGEVMVSADCGISAVDEVKYAQDKGLAVIITDHHEPPSLLPGADAIVNPKQQGCPFPFKELAGVGVAFYLVMALRKALGGAGGLAAASSLNLKKYLDLVALGTVADVVPLVQTNRILVKAGLEVLSVRQRLGVLALSEQCGLHLNAPVTAEDIGYKFAPRINAAGRLGSAKVAVDLLLARTIQDARQASQVLEELNAERKRMEAEFFPLLKKICEEQGREERNVLLVVLQGCHQGILGILAARMTDLFAKPVLVFTEISDGNSIVLKGSGRSMPAINLHKAIELSSRHVLQFGGHPMAVGLTLRPEQFMIFADQINAEVKSAMGDSEKPHRHVDYCCKDSKEITKSVAHSLQLLQPCGEGNPAPVFMLKGESLLNIRKINNHLRFNLVLAGKMFSGIGFDLADAVPDDPCPPVELCFSLKKTWFKGQESEQVYALRISSC